MGLDMYLQAEIYVPGWGYAQSNDSVADGEPSHFSMLNIFKSSSYLFAVTFNVAYWRKANAIHRWFVENLQDGNDDCRRYYADPVHLKKLVIECQKALNPELAQALDLLPPQAGFFFGSDERDEYYYETMGYTIEAVTKALKLEVPLFYTSSW